MSRCHTRAWISGVLGNVTEIKAVIFLTFPFIFARFGRFGGFGRFGRFGG